MGQVPQAEFAIIGSGRMARHFCHYLDLLRISYRQWSRQTDPQYTQLAQIIAPCDRVLLLINDTAIEPFITAHNCLHNKTLLHFSGQLVTKLAIGLHPLMTFNQQLYSLATYQKISFIVEQDAPPFSQLLPGLSNPNFRIDPNKKAFYHALCVLSGNFTVLLWQKFFTELEKTFAIPQQHTQEYLNQIFHNIQEDVQTALTGPLPRNDITTLNNNLQALSGDPFQQVYQAFVNAYQATKQAETV